MPRPPFPHMMPNDLPAFASFVLTPEGKQFDLWEFDVAVGKPADPGPIFDPVKRRIALYLNSLKIDALAWQGNLPTLIECKPTADIGCLGQVIGYQKWYSIMFGVTPQTLVTCEEMSEQIRILMDLNGTTVRILPPAPPHKIQEALDWIIATNAAKGRDIRRNVSLPYIPRGENI